VLREVGARLLADLVWFLADVLKHAAHTMRRLVHDNPRDEGRVLVDALLQVKDHDDDPLAAIAQVVALSDAIIQGGGLDGYLVVPENFLIGLLRKAKLDQHGEVPAVNVVVPTVFRHRQSPR